MGSKVYTPMMTVMSVGIRNPELSRFAFLLGLLTSSNAAYDSQPEREDFTSGAHGEDVGECVRLQWPCGLELAAKDASIRL